MPETWKKGDLVTVNFFDSFKMGNRTEDGVITLVRKDGLIDVEVEKPIRKRVTVPENEVSARGGSSMNKTPSPWGSQSGSHWPVPSGPVDEEYMFTREQLAVNSIPFIKRLLAVLDEADVNSLKLFTKQSHTEQFYKARALLWVLNAQFFGELSKIDMTEEWSELVEALKAGKF